jgi:predicted O-methyltransferase YrrM
LPENAKDVWQQVDDYFGGALLPNDSDLDRALKANREAGLPEIDVTPLQGRFLEVMVRATRARRILEIGTLGGYSTIWLARALPESGVVVTLELESKHAEVARANLAAAGLMKHMDLRVGPAAETLAALVTGSTEPFDFIFIDADKAGYPEYLQWSLKLSRPGTLIIADNVVRDGKVVDPENPDSNIQGVRRFTDLLASEPRVSATVLQTVAGKGYDGFALAVVLR